jgi:agmatinase
MKKTQQFLDDGSEEGIFVPLSAARVVILPVPLEQTVSYLPGTAAGPKKILEASTQVELYDPERDGYPYRVGIHTAAPVDCRGDPAQVMDRIAAALSPWVAEGKVPVCLGGEHSLSFAPVKVLRERYPGLSVLHLDAHADLRDSYHGTKWSHACVMRRVADLGVPSVAVGIRSVCEEEVRFVERRRLPFFPAWEFGEKGYPWERIVRSLSGQVYVTLDLDAFDPSEMPAVGTPEPGGLSWFDAVRLFRLLSRSGKKVVGFDLVELCPMAGAVDSEYFTAKLLYKMISYFCP